MKLDADEKELLESARSVHGSGRRTSRPDASRPKGSVSCSLEEARGCKKRRKREAPRPGGKRWLRRVERPNTNVADCPIRRGSITRLTGCDH